MQSAAHLDLPPEREGRGAAVGGRRDAHGPLPADDVDAAARARRDGVLAEERPPVVEVGAARVQHERVEAVTAAAAAPGKGRVRAPDSVLGAGDGGGGGWARLLFHAMALK